MSLKRIMAAPQMQCAECKQLLSPFDAGEPLPVVYLHAELGKDHKPVPEPRDESTAERCDFCTQATTVTYSLHTMAFYSPPESHETAGYVDDGEWVACPACMDLIRQGDWAGVGDRSKRTLGPSSVAAGLDLRRMAAGIDKMHRSFRENWDRVIPKEPD